jgi:putative membrane protein
LNKLPYDKYSPHEFILRDWLALDRTVLANERTFLAYGRTSLGLFLAGVTLIKVFKSNLAIGTGWVFVFVAIGVFIFGASRFRKMQRHYRTLAALEDKIFPEEMEREFGADVVAEVEEELEHHHHHKGHSAA